MYYKIFIKGQEILPEIKKTKKWLEQNTFVKEIDPTQLLTTDFDFQPISTNIFKVQILENVFYCYLEELKII